MLFRNFLGGTAFLCMAGLVVCSCATKKPATASGEAADLSAANAAEREARLRDVVQDYLRAAPSEAGQPRGKLVHAKPYYYREYVAYPDGPEEFQLVMRETESRTVPHIAEVTARKQRFAGARHRKKKDARNDTSLLRATGTETANYELRNGRWRRVGSLFVAEAIEEYLNGEWVPARQAVERAVVAEQQAEGNWLGRTWSAIAGD